MAKLSKASQAYLVSTFAAALILFLINALRLHMQDSWMMTVALTVIATLALYFKVEGSTNRTHYNISFIVYGFSIVLVGAPEATIIILVSHVIESLLHKYLWYIQVFNVSMYTIVVTTSDFFYEVGNPTRGTDHWENVAAILGAMIVFTLLNHLMVGIIVWLARGENFSRSGIFDFFTLAVDLIMLCMGAGTAVLWMYSPAAIILVLLPLYLIYSTLRVPALERQTETDAKTGVYNHRYFEIAFEAELKRAARFERPLTIIMADLDLLRNINNTYGHLAGDEVLIGIAGILKNTVRDYDVVARFGGEEFAIMMPEITPEQALVRVEQIRQKIEKHPFPVPTSVTPIQATMSFGIASLEPGLTSKDIIHNADMALYHAKLKGRNRAYIYAHEGFESLFSLPATNVQKKEDFASSTEASQVRPSVTKKLAS